MGPLRFIVRILMFSVWTFIIAFAAVFAGIGKWAAVKRLTWFSHIWTFGTAKIIGLKIKIHGDHKSVSGLIISNHLSYIDIILLGAIFPLRYAPKSEIAKWPMLGFALGRSRPIWVNRSSRQAAAKTMNEFIETANHNINLITFPEGTTTNGREGLLPFKSTLFEAAVKGNLSVSPVLIKYREKDNVCWYGDDTLMSHVWNLLKKKIFCADLYILPPIAPEKNDDRKSFAVRVHDIMNAEYLELS